MQSPPRAQGFGSLVSFSSEFPEPQPTLGLMCIVVVVAAGEVGVLLLGAGTSVAQA